MAEAPEAPAEPAPSNEELEWLAQWIDEQSDPDAIGVEQADAALRSRRAKASGAATAALLMERQLLEAKLHAAKRRLERAQRTVARAEAALPAAHADKRQRGEPPAWADREYASYDTVERWRQEEPGGAS
mmetsp:Transcript_2403/g.7389  ORF Transcript_2403/g.7389 Transcript_2403/m.7389 type:complete len:130 (+) Transcript_2403:331-720(+)